jgi:hypothetical protein
MEPTEGVKSVGPFDMRVVACYYVLREKEKEGSRKRGQKARKQTEAPGDLVGEIEAPDNYRESKTR